MVTSTIKVQVTQDQLERLIKNTALSAKEMDMLQKEVSETGAATVSLDKVMGAQANTLAELKEKADLLTEAYENLNKEADPKAFRELQSELQKTNSAIKTLEDSVEGVTIVEKFDGAVKIGAALAGVFGTASAAAQAFGEDVGLSAEEIEKAQLKVQVLVAALETLKLVTEAVSSENKLLGGTLGNLVGGLKTFVVGTETATTGISTFGKVGRLALVSIGIGAVILAVTTLIANFDKIVEVLRNVGEQPGFKPVVEFIDASIAKVRDFLSLITGGAIDDSKTAKIKSDAREIAKAAERQSSVLSDIEKQREKEISLIGSSLKSTEARLKAEAEINKKLIDQYNAAILVAQQQEKSAKAELDRLNAIGAGTDDISKAQERLSKAQSDSADLVIKKNSIIQGQQQALAEERQRQLEAQKASEIAIQETVVSRLERQRGDTRKTIDENIALERKLAEEKVRLIKLSDDAEIAALRKREKELRATGNRADAKEAERVRQQRIAVEKQTQESIAAVRQEELQNVQKFENDKTAIQLDSIERRRANEVSAAQAALETSVAGYDTQLRQLEDFLRKQEELLKVQRDKEILAAQGNPERLRQVEEKFQDDLTKLRQEGESRRLGLARTNLEDLSALRQTELEGELAAQSRVLQDSDRFVTRRLEDSKKFYALRRKQIDDDTNAELDALRDKDGNIDESNAKVQLLYAKRSDALEEVAAQEKETNAQIIADFGEQVQGALGSLQGLAQGVSDALTASAQKSLDATNERLDAEEAALEERLAALDEQLSALDESASTIEERISALSEQARNATGEQRKRILDALVGEQAALESVRKEQKRVADEKKRAEADQKRIDADRKKAQDDFNAQQEKSAQVQRIFAGVQAAVAVATLAATTAAKDFTFGVGTIAAIVALGGTIASLIAQFADVGGVIGEFSNGGFTAGTGSRDRTGFRTAGVVHEGEYVIPKRVMETPRGRSIAKAAESLRVDMGYPRKSRGGFDVGGFTNTSAVSSAATAPTQETANIADALARTEIFVAVTDINEGQQRVAKIVDRAS